MASSIALCPLKNKQLMKLKNLLVLGLMTLPQLSSFAQDKKANPKHINYFKPASVDTKDVKIDIQ